MLELKIRSQFNKLWIAAAALLLFVGQAQAHYVGPAGLLNALDPMSGPPSLLHQALYNGTDVHQEPLEHFPRFLVLIESTKNNGDIAHCTGSALASDVILTAGHCLNEARAIRVKVIRSTHPIKYNMINAKAWRAHPNANGGFDGPHLDKFNSVTAKLFHDIGLIVLAKASSDVEPIMLAPPNYNPVGSGAWIFVFGQGRDHQYRITGKLEFAELQTTVKISDSDLYAANLKENQGWCVRDSGGPVTVGADGINGGQQHYLLGVAFAFFNGFQHGDKAQLKKTWGDLKKVPGCGSRVGYSLIGNATDWIESTLKEMLPGESRPLLHF